MFNLVIMSNIFWINHNWIGTVREVLWMCDWMHALWAGVSVAAAVFVLDGCVLKYQHETKVVSFIFMCIWKLYQLSTENYDKYYILDILALIYRSYHLQILVKSKNANCRKIFWVGGVFCVWKVLKSIFRWKCDLWMPWNQQLQWR